jgi:hypothetical protein
VIRPTRRAGAIALMAIAVAIIASESAAAEVPDFSADGWHTWRVPAFESTGDWCCIEWYSGEARRTACDLDSNRVSYGSSDSIVDESGQIQIYALVQGGEATKIRALSSQCPVMTTTDIIDLGIVESNDSVKWLEQYVAPRTKMSTHALAEISIHDGPGPFDLLVSIAQHDASLENRKDAVFWLVQTESQQAFAFIEQLLTDI